MLGAGLHVGCMYTGHVLSCMLHAGRTLVTPHVLVEHLILWRVGSRATSCMLTCAGLPHS